MKKHIYRIFSLFLCLALIVACAFPTSALTVRKTYSTTKCTILTCGDKVLGKTTITIKNTGGSPIRISFTKISNCKATRSTGAGISSWSSITILTGNSATIKIKTNFGKNGTVIFKAISETAESYSYTVTGSNYSTIARTA